LIEIVTRNEYIVHHPRDFRPFQNTYSYIRLNVSRDNDYEDHPLSNIQTDSGREDTNIHEPASLNAQDVSRRCDSQEFDEQGIHMDNAYTCA
jgi:hypothetical protein